MKPHNLKPGDIYNRLTVVSVDGIYVTCLCECGNEKRVRRCHLVCNKTQSCGCLHSSRMSETHRTHGGTVGGHSKEYGVWSGMKTRCYNPARKSYKDYGGRGITVCDRWLESFENFLADMGPCPTSEHSIDRIKNNAGYSPENCRWATKIEQANNSRRVNYIEFNGKRQSLTAWAKEIGVSRDGLTQRFRKGWSVEKALSTTNNKKNSPHVCH